MRNTLDDAMNHIFVIMERLNDPDLTTEELKMEMQKGKVMANLSNQVIQANALKLTGLKMISNGNVRKEDVQDIKILPAKN